MCILRNRHNKYTINSIHHLQFTHYTNLILSSLPPLDAPFFPPLTHDTPRRELMGSWGQRPCQPGSSCSTATARDTGNARPQPTRIASRRAKMAPNPSTQRTSALQAARRTTPSTPSTPTRPCDTPPKGEPLSHLTQYSFSLFRHSYFPYKNHYSNRRCTRQHNHAQRAHFTESHAKIAVNRLQCTSTTRQKRVRRSRPKRKIYSLGGLSDSLPRRTVEAAAVLLRHKRRNGPGRTNDTAPRSPWRQYNQTGSCLAGTETVSSLFTSGAAHASAHHLHSSTNDDVCDCIYAAYHDVHVEMNHDYGVSPGALRPGGPWPDGIG